MYKPINGHTKVSIIKAIEAGNKGKRSMVDNTCSYLNPITGNKCAVGCFIPDGHPGQKVVSSATGLLNRYPGLKNKMPLPLDALNDFQGAHDNARASRVTFNRFTHHNVKVRLAIWINRYVA